MGRTALHAACEHGGCVATVRLLLCAGARINARDSKLQTPLHVACDDGGGGVNVVRVLLDFGK